MASNSRFGWHSGVMKCKEARVLGDLKIQKNLIFGDVSFGELAITGRVVTSSEAGANIVIGSTHAYAEGFELRYSVDSWAGIGTTSTFQGIYLRVQNNVDAASASLRGLSVVTYSNAYNTAQIEGAFFETGVKSISGNKTVGPIYGMESQISIYNATSGTLTITEQTNVGIAAGRFQIGLGSGLADYTCVYGIIIQTNDASLGTRTLGSGILLRNHPVEGTQTWTNGIDIQSACTTGINFTGTFDVGIELDDSSTKGIAIGASATGIYIYGCTSQSIFVGQAMTEATKPVEFYGLASSETKGSTQGVLQIYIKREQVLSSSDGNPDTALKIKGKNEEANTSSYGGIRGIDLEVQNEEANASTAFIHGAYLTAANSSDINTQCDDMQVLQCIMSNQGIVDTTLYGIQVLENSEGTVPTDTVGIKVTTSSNAPASGSRADGIMVTTGGASGGWTDGIHIAGTITNAINISGTTIVTGIDIGACTTGINISGTYAAVNSRAIKTDITVDTAVYGDGYSANEFQLTITGTSTGHIACAGAWVNATGAGIHGAGGNFIAAQTNGIYQRTSTITDAIVIFGMRMAHDCSGTDAAGYFPFSIVSAGGTNTTTALFHTSAAAINMGAVTDAGSDDGVLVPLYQEGGSNIGYVKIYSLS